MRDGQPSSEVLEGNPSVAMEMARALSRDARHASCASRIPACALRRGLQAVEVIGTAKFRKEASRALLLRGIEVLDCPLSEAKQAALRGEGIGVDWEALEGMPEPGLVPRPPWADA